MYIRVEIEFTMNRHLTYRFLAICVFIMTTLSLKSNELLIYRSARSLALGGASVALPNEWDAPSSFATTNHHFAVQLGYHNQYTLSELSTYRLGVAYAFPFMETRFHLSRFGFQSYNETLISCNFSKRLFKNLSLGIRINYLSLYFPEATRVSILSPELALAYQQNEKWGITFHTHPPLAIFWKPEAYNYQIPTFYRLGMYGNISDITCIVLEISKKNDKSFHSGIGAEFHPLPSLPIRLGISLPPFIPSIGIGWEYQRIQLDASFAWHSTLGISSAIQFSYSL